MLTRLVSGILLLAGIAEAAPISAELKMGAKRSWKGQIISREGDWIEFKTTHGPQPIRIGAGSITELIFEVEVDAKKIRRKMANREYNGVISILDKAISPFSEYADIPSNLTKYNALLMELYYRIGQYEKSLTISSKIVGDDRNPVLQKKSRMYQVLALIDGGKVEEAEALVAQYGWDQEVSGATSPEHLYITAKLLALKKKYSEAMQCVAKVIAFNSQDPDWMRPAELLCAEIYTELGLYDSAEEVCRQIELFYKNTPEFDAAAKLRVKIEKLRKGTV